MPEKTNVAAGAALSPSSDAARPERVIKEGDVLKLRTHPYGKASELHEGEEEYIRAGEMVLEVTVTSIKKAVISFE